VSALPLFRFERQRAAKPGNGLTSQQAAALMRALADPTGPEPDKILAKLRDAGYALEYVRGKDPASKAFATAEEAKRWARGLRDSDDEKPRRWRRPSISRSQHLEIRGQTR
jgi:hypothetical protein